jgi:ubiquitin-activating enzyme E1
MKSATPFREVNCIVLVFRILLLSALGYAFLLLTTFSLTVLIVMVQWARDLFDGLYNRRPMQVNNNIKAVLSIGISEVVLLLQDRLGEEVGLETAQEIAEDLELSIQFLDGQADFMNSCILWAVRLFYRMFVESIKQLLHQHPEESLDEDGQPFWSKSRRMPQIIEYRVVEEDDALQKEINEYIVKFVQNAARLRFETYYGNDDTFASTPSTSLVTSILEKFLLNDFYQCSDAISRVAEKINASKEKLEGCLMNVVEFEKDNQNNGHVAFVSAASNLRALNYGIMPVGMLETRRISGNIVPAMITTTALVSALSCIELFKLIKATPLNLHRNAFVNLALPFFAFTSPLPAEPMVGLHGKTHTIWDKIVINEGKKSASSGGIQLSELLRKVKKKTGGRLTSLYYGPFMIYADFLHSDDDRVSKKPVFELVKEALMSDHSVEDAASGVSGTLDVHSSVDVENFDKKSFLELSGVVEDEETGEDAEIPPIQIKKWIKGKNRLS